MKILNILDIKLNSKEKTHFAIFNGSQIKYLVDINDKEFYHNLIDNQSSYSIKHKIFKKIIKFIPKNLISTIPNIKWCNVEINSHLSQFLKEKISDDILAINYIIGTEGKHQKIVLQVISNYRKIYIKVGNEKTKKLIVNENSIYKMLNNMKFDFTTPKLLFEYSNHNIYLSALSEIKGKEINIDLTEDVINIYRQISNIKNDYINGIEFEFSHGDFTPWNIKKYMNKYVVYDWEYAQTRFAGYDILHYIFQVETLIYEREKTQALEKAILVAKKYVPFLNRLDNEEIKNLYIKESKITYME